MRTKPERAACGSLRSLRLSLGFLLCFVLVLTACRARGPATEARPLDDPKVVGREVYEGDAVWVEAYEDEELGSTLRYRQLLDLEAFTARADRPVLLVLRDGLDPGNPQLVLSLEKLAIELDQRAYILLVESTYEDRVIEQLEDLALPAYYWIEKGAVRHQVEGADREGIRALIDDLRAIK